MTVMATAIPVMATATRATETATHWHYDNHPDGHCGPNYVIGDVVAPGWCGVILGSFTD